MILVRARQRGPNDVQGDAGRPRHRHRNRRATSHAAVISREIGRPAVVGCGTGVAEALNGKLITIDGTEGEVREGILSWTAWSENDTLTCARWPTWPER